MEGSERDSTQDWLLPEAARPPLLGELEARIDEAVVIARASEAVVTTIGAAALDAAEQARRAAELAERASAAMLDRKVSSAVEDESLRLFTERADRISRRLRALECVPVPTSGRIAGRF